MANTAEILKMVEKSYVRTDLPKLSVGDNIKMKIKVAEADKIRLHPFEGMIIKISGSGIKKTFTVRKVSFGEGVEKTFPICSPVIESITVVNSGRARRSRLYYLRERSGKSARVARDQQEAPSVSAS